jgi:hypothetical protein
LPRKTKKTLAYPRIRPSLAEEQPKEPASAKLTPPRAGASLRDAAPRRKRAAPTLDTPRWRLAGWFLRRGGRWYDWRRCLYRLAAKPRLGAQPNRIAPCLHDMFKRVPSVRGQKIRFHRGAHAALKCHRARLRMIPAILWRSFANGSRRWPLTSRTSMNAAVQSRTLQVELPEKGHPARWVIEEAKAAVVSARSSL